MKIAGLYPQRVERGPQGEPEFLEPLGLEYVLAQAGQHHDVQLFTFFKKTPEQVVQEVIDYKPNILAVSAMTPQINLGLKIAGEIKKKKPKIMTVFGGYHPTAMPSLIQRPEVDFLIQGEGEVEFQRVIEGDLTGKKVIRSNRIRDLDLLQEPLRPDFLEQLRNHGTMYPPASEQIGFTSVLFSRGCLFNCDFCSSPSMYGGGVTYRAVSKVVDEIEKLNRQRGLNTFLFCDLNFTANKEKTKELCRAISNSGIEIYWECLANIATSNDSEMLKLMRNAGCRKIGWGIESLNPEVVALMGKTGLNLTEEVLQKSEDSGILNTGFYIIGHPSETPANILRFSNKLKSLPLHRVRVTTYTPLPGIRLFTNMNLQNPNFDLYDTTNMVFNHPVLTQELVDNLRAIITQDFYSSHEYKDRAKRVAAKFPEYAGVLR